ncbi:MAG TPA: TlpA disulfide reductase family protein, partial [Gemmataceae bacterium]|nr:TlpA disulfide reductase family protein [Gemmataceae bacterium]
RSGFDRSAPPGPVSGVLAGQIIDNFNRKPPPTTIQIVSVQDGKETGAAPITVKHDPVSADVNGYFTIQNLQPGRQYQLIARAEDGTKKFAGVTWATPPNPRITIRISEDFAGRDIPEGQPPPRRSGNPPNPRSGSADDKTKSPPAYIEAPIVPSHHESPNPGWSGSGGATGGGAEMGAPVPGNREPQPRTPSIPNFEGTVKGPDIATRHNRDLVEIPTQAPRDDPGEKSAPAAIDTGRAGVPSCSLSGKLLHNLALNDIDGKPWDYRHDHKGRLMLVDFWGTWCVPCQHAILHLKDLQWRYGPWGLEVVGIAYEYGPPAQQALNVRRVANRLGTNYRLLLGSGYDSACPVRQQFQVRKYPSLFLIDEKGTIVWESREGLGERELQELEFEIKKRLNVR